MRENGDDNHEVPAVVYRGLWGAKFAGPKAGTLESSGKNG
jgi:hypothetical protein